MSKPPLPPSVYLETTIPSYLASRPSRDLVTAAHQQITREWWRAAQYSFRLYISQAVLDEIRAGDPEVAAKRLTIVQDLPILALGEEVAGLAEIYRSRLGLSDRARIDLVHIAFAVAYNLDYLVTWNCNHIANGSVIRRLGELNRQLQKQTPVVVTPEELQPISFEEEGHEL